MNTENSAEKLLIPEASPESVGVPSGAVLSMLKEFDDKRLPMHSLLILRNGKLVSENYWKPFHRDRKHRLYSISKSFTSLAVGIMADEGKIGLDDKIADHFPEYMTADAHEYTKRATIRDMLMMADCHADHPYGFGDTNWVKTWFDKPVTHPAGSVFNYNTCCTNLCCAVVEKISGMSFIDYLYPRLLTPVGASEGITCIKSPEGYSFGGSGVLARPLDLALVMLVCMNKGAWNGKQLISEEFIREATSMQIDNSVTGNFIDEQQGYGYQFWRTRHNGFACYGMGSQYAICLPDKDLVVITTADTQGIATGGYIVHETVYAKLLPFLSDDPLPEDDAAINELKTYSASMELPVVPGKPHSPVINHVSGKTYTLANNPMNIKTVRFDFGKDDITMTYEKASGNYSLKFGIGKLIIQSFPETHYCGMQIGVSADRGYESRASAAWSTENCLRAKLYVTDIYFGSFSMNVSFIGDEVTIIMTKIAESFLDDYQGTATGKITV